MWKMKRNRKAKEHSFTHFSFVFRSVGFTSTDRYMFQFWMWSVSKKKKSPQRRNRLHESHSLFYLWLSLVHTSLLRASEQAKCFWLLFFSHTQQLKKKKREKSQQSAQATKAGIWFTFYYCPFFTLSNGFLQRSPIHICPARADHSYFSPLTAVNTSHK